MLPLVTGRGLVESPRWHGGRLWFADWIAGEILAVDHRGAIEVVVRHQSLPLCFDFLPDGTPLLVSGPRHAVLRREPAGELIVHADMSTVTGYGGNDIVVDGRGNAYVNGAGYDPRSGQPPEPPAGFVALIRPDGTATTVADGLAFPNGMAITADGTVLVVAESHRNRLTAFDIDRSGELSGRRVWADLGDGGPRAVRHRGRLARHGRDRDDGSVERAGPPCTGHDPRRRLARPLRLITRRGSRPPRCGQHRPVGASAPCRGARGPARGSTGRRTSAARP